MDNIYYQVTKDTYVRRGISPIGFFSRSIRYEDIPGHFGMVVFKDDRVCVIFMEHLDSFLTWLVWNPDECEDQFGFRPQIDCGLGALVNGAREFFPVLSVL